jgi:hypothetical protein
MQHARSQIVSTASFEDSVAQPLFLRSVMLQQLLSQHLGGAIDMVFNVVSTAK